ncbi:MAG: fasciclin domain-containing protein [Alphaproteobacteria bacterium]|nr:fasciclin domain-containing protein [Alphaproteobacteria bacterium]MBU2271136.1 fasciclin domain-containing protein [Alphaproteobacteria bacterium]MBU2418189.1 fasciclin domain-containing protein [Alphaproteobacteria bacterium]
MKFTRYTAVAAVSAAALAVAACSNSTETAPAETATTDTAAMEPAATTSGTVVTVAQGNPDFTTLVSAIQTAELADTLNGAGPFTVFAPTNAAFEKVPAATRDSLMAPAGKEDLTRILTYHVVPGRVDAAALTQQIQAGGGTATLTTVQGGTLTARAEADGSITLTDAAGGTAKVVQADVAASNGVIHAVDTVVMPG